MREVSRKNFFAHLKKTEGKKLKSFTEYAIQFGYPEENGSNLCKKDYYRFLKNNIRFEAATISKEDNAPVEKVNLDKLMLRRAWEAQTPDGIKVLKSYQNNITPAEIIAFRDELLNDIKKISPERKAFVREKTKNTNKLLISLPDLHVGRESPEATKTKYLSAIESLAVRGLDSGIDEIVYIVGNDLFNSDNPNYQTTKGTPQFDYQEWRESFLIGVNIIKQSIGYLKTFNLPISLLFIEGNHDHMKLFMLSQIMEAYYSNDSQINIVKGGRFHNYNFGTVAMMFDHGELKMDDYPSVFAAEYPKSWGNSTFRYVFNGHLHHTIQKAYRGNVRVFYLPSLAEHSEWEKSKAFSSDNDLKEGQAFIINPTTGLQSILYTYI